MILGLTDEKQQQLAAEHVIKEGLNVRQTEGLVAKLQTRGARKAGTKPETVAAPPAIRTWRIWRRSCAKCLPRK